MLIQKIALLYIFVCQPNILVSLGIYQSATNIYIQGLLGVGLLYSAYRRKKNVRIELFIFSFWVCLLFYRYANGILSGSVQYSLHLLVPALLSAALPDSISSRRESSLYRFAFRLLVVYITLEVAIGVFEFVTKSHLFLWIDSVYETHLTKVQLRPIGMSGSPLMNSWVITGTAICVLFSSLRPKYKVTMFAVCLVGLFAYQGRMSLAFSMIAFLIYVGFAISQKQISVSFLTIAVLAIILLVYLFFNTRMGERFLAFDDDGGSAGMRFMALEYFFNQPISDFFFGLPLDKMENEQAFMNVVIIECAIICQTMLYGLFFTLPFYFAYFLLLLRIRSGDGRRNAILLYVLFFALINTGIGWFSGSYSLVIFLLAAKIFTSATLRNILPQKYVHHEAEKYNYKQKLL